MIGPVDHRCAFNGAGERFSHRPWGLFGGAPGASGQFLLIGENGGESRLANKPTGIEIGPNQTIVIEIPGGRGATARRRNARPEALREDAESGKFSGAYMSRHYQARQSAE